jgi:hypothetical protein
MSTEENNQGVVVDTTNNEGEGAGEDTVSLLKDEYDKLNQTIGSLKRELKDLKKPKEEIAKETPKTNSSPDDNRLLEKAFLRSANIVDSEEVELALTTANKWGVSIDALVDDEDFKIKLDKLRTQKANDIATSKVKGGGNQSQTKNTPEYWIAKGTPPTPDVVPDRATRAKIIRAMMSDSKGGKKFYNE